MLMGLSSLRCSIIGVVLLLLSTETIIAAPAGSGPPKCQSVLRRREWNTLSIKQRTQYISSVKCLQSKPGVGRNTFGIKRFTRYEDFIYQHKIQAPYVHFVSHFLHFHRNLISAFETALREECGYTGAQPYIDLRNFPYDDFNSAPLMSNSSHGFGSNGNLVNGGLPPIITPGFPPPPAGTGGGCIQGGPFKDVVLRFPRMNLTTDAPDPHCIERNFLPVAGHTYLTPVEFETTMGKEGVDQFAKYLEGRGERVDHLGIHSAAHQLFGGTLMDPFTSPGDPLFWMIHSYIDFIWRKWQKEDWEVRKSGVEGTPVPWLNIMFPDLSTIPEGPTSLEFPLELGPLAPKRTIKDVMDTAAAPMCYDYVE